MTVRLDWDDVRTLVPASACSLNEDEPFGAYVLGHDRALGWALRELVIGDMLDGARWDAPWPRRIYWRDVPWSIAYPDEPPCENGAEESITFERCAKDKPGAYAVTVIEW
ncbi:hypothetical protein UFOVP1383_16 [uncultured Caudovirales phage]|uniref:Uncharacterized protein n=1 Tax=uncultured Caudovirales phage TaxID=2100421 RepID=A0A6J5S5Y3_9CAUD|nr:hypothetical protein UFOVP848_25 [uncultured Caudovirales phage]CAB4173353.1 hypothetical protein UFOVP945_40 [uncultured Caudovirales phage]CAB4179587.1 hypothetical protein UFOVP1023_2 [uncultured Caudovirales phage]CAB4203928.1 hypothetical protein UFOVP1383_16 [uncultured Caudovirales phage]CAB4215958.1 hypothetical protein UFOVP1477_32 [uncultured Caudovirales phage]